MIYLLQRSPESPSVKGLIGGSVIGMGTPYVETNQLGVTNSEAVRRDGIAICGFGSQMVPILFGQGIEFRLLRDPQETGVCNTRYRCRCNFAHRQPPQRHWDRPALTRVQDPNI